MAKDSPDKPKSPTLRVGLVVNPPPRQSLAAGYWGRSPRATVLSTQTVERIIKNNSDMLRGMGFSTSLWVEPEFPKNSPLCSCVKTTNKSADQRCAKCYGLSYVPGYVKWGYNTSYLSAVDTIYGLPNTLQKFTDTTQHTIGLAAGVLSAQLVTPDFSVFNPFSDGWEMEAKVYNRDRGNNHLVEWSIDEGGTWSQADISTLHLERGLIRFRITLTRTNANTVSPLFEIIRLRHPIQRELSVRIARPMGRRKRTRETTGQVEAESGLEYWTVPIMGKAQINGQDVFTKQWLPQRCIFEVLEGTFAGSRYLPTEVKHSEHLGMLTSQWFPVRLIVQDEIFNAVF